MAKRVYNRAVEPSEEEITMREALKILRRSRASFFNLKRENRIAPIAKDGNKHLYSRKDVMRLKSELVTYF